MPLKQRLQMPRQQARFLVGLPLDSNRFNLSQEEDRSLLESASTR
jgi:hypothetical protein